MWHDPLSGYPIVCAEGHAKKCRDCKEQVGNTIPHTFSEWRVVREATETEDGLRHRECDQCTYTEDEVIPKTGASSKNPEVPDLPETPAVPVAPSDDGCSAVLVSGAPAMLALIAAAGWMLRKKKQ
jgi:hypothetical protein